MKLKTKQGYTLEDEVVVFDGKSYKKVFASEVTIGVVVCIDRSVNNKTKPLFNLPKPTYVRPRHATSVIDIKLPQVVDQNLSKWLGYVIANGSKSKTAVHFSTANDDIMQEYNQLCVKVFGKAPAVYTERKKAKNIALNSVIVSSYLEDIFDGFGTARVKKMPKGFREYPLEVKRTLLRSLMDCDSSFANNVVSFHSASESVASEVHLALLDFGIVSSKRSKTVKSYPDHIYWNVNVSSKDLDLLFERVLHDSIKYKGYKRNVPINTNIDVIPLVKDILLGHYEKGKVLAGCKKNGMYFCPVENKFKRFTLGFAKEPTKELTFPKAEFYYNNYTQSDDFIRDCFKEFGETLRTVLDQKYFHDFVIEKE
jgi:hypothetical protein